MYNYVYNTQSLNQDMSLIKIICKLFNQIHVLRPRRYGIAPGLNFPEHVTKVTYVAKDRSGNEAVCYVYVTVIGKKIFLKHIYKYIIHLFIKSACNKGNLLTV